MATNQQKLDALFDFIQPVSRAGDKFSDKNGKVALRQEIADAKSYGMQNAQAIASLAGAVAGLTKAVQQLAATPASPVDLSQVTAAAQVGANKALENLRVVSTAPTE